MVVVGGGRDGVGVRGVHGGLRLVVAAVGGRRGVGVWEEGLERGVRGGGCVAQGVERWGGVGLECRVRPRLGWVHMVGGWV